MWRFALRQHPTTRMSRYISICWASCTILDCIACIECTDAGYCHRYACVTWLVGLFVCVLVARLSRAKTAEPIDTVCGGRLALAKVTINWHGRHLANIIKRHMLSGDASRRYHYCINLLLLFYHWTRNNSISKHCIMTVIITLTSG